MGPFRSVNLTRHLDQAAGQDFCLVRVIVDERQARNDGVGIYRFLFGLADIKI